MKLTTERIVDAGMAAFAEVGYQGVSMRQVADRLDAHAGSLYYHVKNKDALLRLMADRVARQGYDAGTAALAQLPAGAAWPTRVEAQAAALRHSILHHPGGAILLAESPKSLSGGALSLMERLLRTLVDGGVPAPHAIIAADTLLSHTTGFALQEQTEPPIPPVDAAAYADLHARFPLTTSGAAAYPQEEKFLRGVRLICLGIRALINGEDLLPLG
ncbi:TetR/AcrR family transcriptional regulator [Nocardia sp. NBC_01327]|uniref:TetR/AcrR family transcriptional regulator n=1 Tax=Nocardia sp. NBC_01327 TaxID=2903593 RepID=UPI002E0F8E9C|nr:TetR family transcriptional regulator [Nocardia sp. NBC_01327]